MKYVKKAGYIVATILFLVFTLGPFVWTFVMAITPKAEMFSNVVSLLPSHITWSNFQNLFSGGRRSVAYFTGLKNSLRAVIVTICIGMPIALVSAYTLSRMEFPGRKIIKNALLITMVIPVMATIIPLYKMFSAGHMLDNTFWLSMVYVSSYLPMATWMIINYFSTIPKELEEAAVLDGCNPWQTFTKVMFPITRSSISALGVFTALFAWKDLMWPLIANNDINKMSLAPGLSVLQGVCMTNKGAMMAGSVIATVPMVILYFIFQKQFMEGIAQSGIKG